MEEIKIKIQIKNINNLLANANISIPTIDFGYVTIKGFQIWKSNKFNGRLSCPINITPPSKKTFATYVQQVFFESPEKWFELEQLIYEKFIEEGGSFEEVKIEDIPDNL